LVKVGYKLRRDEVRRHRRRILNVGTWRLRFVDNVGDNDVDNVVVAAVSNEKRESENKKCRPDDQLEGDRRKSSTE